MELGELESVFTDSFGRVIEGGFDVSGLELAEALEGPEGMEPTQGREWAGLVGGEGAAQGWGDFNSVTFDQETLCGEAPPGIAMAQQGDQQVVLLEIVSDGWSGAVETARGDPPDASTVGSGTDILFLSDPFRDVVGVFDDLPVHVEEVEGAIGPHLKADGSEVGIAACDEFTMRFLGGATGDEHGSVGLDPFAMDEIADDIADEDGALEIGRPGAASEESHSTGGGEVSGLLGMIGAGDGLGDGKDPGHFAMVGDAAGGAEGGKTGSAVIVRAIHEPMLDVIDVVGGEPATPVVLDQAEPAAGPAGQRDPPGVGIECEVVVTELNWIPGKFRSKEAAAIAAVGAMDAVVEAEAESVDEAVADSAAEAGNDDLALVGGTIAVGVPEEQDVGCGGDEHAPAPGSDGGGVAQVGGEDGGAVDLAVAIPIFEQADGGTDLAIGSDAVGVVAAFGDIGATGFVEGHGDGVHDIGFSGPELENEAGIGGKAGGGRSRGSLQGVQRETEQGEEQEATHSGAEGDRALRDVKRAEGQRHGDGWVRKS